MPLECFHCRKPVEVPSPAVGPIGFRETCPHCHSDLHVCRNCEFFDEASHHECRETAAEWVKKKDTSNICDYFRPRMSAAGQRDDKQKALDALDALFKK